MRLISREEFLTLPSNTLYCRVRPWVFDELEIKGESWEGVDGRFNDFLYQQIVGSFDCSGSDELFDTLERALPEKLQLKPDFDCLGRDGRYDNDGMFLIWEREDVEALIERLKECL